MSDRSFDQLIEAWMDLGPAMAPNRVLEAVRLETRATRQTAIPQWWPPRRFLHMNIIARFGLAAAVVVAALLVGFVYLAGSRIGGPDVSVPASASPSMAVPTPTVQPSPTPEAAIPPAGPLAVGTHRATPSGVLAIFDIATEGWVSNGSFGMDKGKYVTAGRPDAPESAGFIFWMPSAPDTVFADPCAGTLLSPAPEQAPEALAAAVASLPGIELVSGPTEVTVGGYAAQHVAIRVPADIGCDPSDFLLWEDTDNPGQTRYATAIGSTIHSWIVDVEGALVWIDAETYAFSGPQAEEEILDIIDSIRFRAHRGPG